jgi:hypothetical protein
MITRNQDLKASVDHENERMDDRVTSRCQSAPKHVFFRAQVAEFGGPTSVHTH